MNKKIIVASIVGVLALGVTIGGSTYCNIKVEEKIKETLDGRKMEYGNINCNILFGNNCSAYNLFADSKKNEKAKKITLYGLRQLIIDKEKELSGNRKYTLKIEGLTNGAGKSIFDQILKEDAKRMIGEDNEKLLRNDIIVALDVNLDFQKDKVLFDLLATGGIEKFPLSTSMGLSGYVDKDLQTLKQLTLVDIAQKLIAQKATLSMTQKNSFISQVIHNIYLEKSKTINPKTPLDWKIYNQSFFNGNASKFKLSDKDSAFTVADFRMLGTQIFTDISNEERKNMLKNNPLRNFINEKDFDIVVKKVFGKDETLTLSLFNLKNLPITTASEILMKNQIGVISPSMFKNVFRTEIN